MHVCVTKRLSACVHCTSLRRTVEEGEYKQTEGVREGRRGYMEALESRGCEALKSRSGVQAGMSCVGAE